MFKKLAPVIIASMLATPALADVPDISGLTLDEMLQLQGTVNEQIAAQATYTLLPGVYNCKTDFKYNWYNCKVNAGPNGEEKISKITFHTYGPHNPEFLSYEVSSNDAGIKISVLPEEMPRDVFMVVQGAPLEAVPYSGF